MTTIGSKTFATAAEAREYQVNQWSEKQFQDHVMLVARRLGWLIYHTHDSRRSVPGFPDLVLVHPRHGVLFRELKTKKGRVSPDQKDWIAQLTAAGSDADIWRPADLLDQTINDQLTKGAHS